MAETNSAANRPCVTITSPITSAISRDPSRLRGAPRRRGPLDTPIAERVQYGQRPLEFGDRRVLKGRERNKRKRDAERRPGLRLRHALDRRTLHATDRQRDLGEWQTSGCYHANAAGFQQTIERVGGATPKPPRIPPDQRAIVSDQDPVRGQRLERQIALAGSGRALDQHAPPGVAAAPCDQPGVQDHPPMSASVTMKRAPRTAPVSSVRFSARIFQPCASTIWRAIESPSPE